MPTYEYRCTKCSSNFEVKKSFRDSPDAFCPSCNGEARRVFSPVPIFFKGPGFYVTDNGSGRRNGAGNTKEAHHKERSEDSGKCSAETKEST